MIHTTNNEETRKMAFISIHLFGKPAWEINSKEIDGPALRGVGDGIKAVMDTAADTVDKLSADGWDINMGLYEINCTKNDLPQAEAKIYLEGLGISPDDYIELYDE